RHELARPTVVVADAEDAAPMMTAEARYHDHVGVLSWSDPAQRDGAAGTLTAPRTRCAIRLEANHPRAGRDHSLDPDPERCRHRTVRDKEHSDATRTLGGGDRGDGQHDRKGEQEGAHGDGS